MSAMPPDELALMALQVEALYRCTPEGRLLTVNEVGLLEDQPVAQRFFMGRTLRGNVWRVRHDLPNPLVEELERLCRAEPSPLEWMSPPQQRDKIMALLDTHSPI